MSPEAGGAASGPVQEPGFESAPPVETPGGGTGTGTGAGEGQGAGVVVVAGPTLENRYPEVWNVFRGADARCTIVINGSFSSGAEVPVRVVDVRVTDERPVAGAFVWPMTRPRRRRGSRARGPTSRRRG